VSRFYIIEHVYAGATKPIVVVTGEAKTVPHAKRLYAIACSTPPTHPDLMQTRLREKGCRSVLIAKGYRLDTGKDSV
jgi:hypothetical protein